MGGLFLYRPNKNAVKTVDKRMKGFCERRNGGELFLCCYCSKLLEKKQLYVFLFPKGGDGLHDSPLGTFLRWSHGKKKKCCLDLETNDKRKNFVRMFSFFGFCLPDLILKVSGI